MGGTNRVTNLMTKLVVKAVKFVVWDPNRDTGAFFTHPGIDIVPHSFAKAVGMGTEGANPQQILQLVNTLNSVLEPSIAVGVVHKVPRVLIPAVDTVGVRGNVRNGGAHRGGSVRVRDASRR
jgi:hypothetical protein